MEIIELTPANITEYMSGCIAVQKYLVTDPETITKDNFFATAAADNYFVAVLVGKEVAGLGVINKIIHPVRSNGYIDNIVVHPKFRGKGLFGFIMDDLEKKATEWGMYSVKLTCAREVVQTMYKRRNYREKIETKYYEKVL